MEPSIGDIVIGDDGCYIPGTTTSIICEVMVSFGTPYNVIWKKDGSQIESIQSDQSAIHTFHADSPGTYTCTASNEFGSHSASSVLYGKLRSFEQICVGGDMYYLHDNYYQLQVVQL